MTAVPLRNRSRSAARRSSGKVGPKALDPLLDNDRSASRHARKTRPAFEQLLGVIREARSTS